VRKRLSLIEKQQLLLDSLEEEEKEIINDAKIKTSNDYNDFIINKMGDENVTDKGNDEDNDNELEDIEKFLNMKKFKRPRNNYNRKKKDRSSSLSTPSPDYFCEFSEDDCLSRNENNLQ
jgi:hypothetical protein